MQAVFRVERSRTKEEAVAALAHLRDCVDGETEPGLDRFLSEWLEEDCLPTAVERFKPLGHKTLNEVYSMLVEDFVSWTDQWRAEGRAKGREEGRAEAIREMLYDIAVSRFGEDAARSLALELNAVRSPTELRGLSLRLLDGATAQELLDAVRQQ